MSERLVWVDVTKGWLILLVIMGHCIAATIGNDAANVDYWWCLIYSFHMPAFIAISGYLNYRGATKNSIKVGKVANRRFQQLMVPFFVWSLIKYATEGTPLKFYNCILYPTNTFWFLWALFFIVIFFSLFDWFSQKTMFNQEVIMGVVCLGCAGTMAVLKDVRLFGIQYVLYYFIFYCLGYYINKYRLLTCKKWVIAILLLVWFVMGSFWRPRELPEFIHLTGEMASMFRFVYKFAVAFVAVFAMFSFATLALSKKCNWNDMICRVGAVSLGIYTFHLTFVNICVNLLKHIVTNDIALVLVSFVTLSMVSYIVVILLGKWKWSARVMLGKF